MGQIVLLDPNVFFYGLWLGIQSVLDPVTRSKVVMLRGEAAREAYADVQWRGAPDPAMADWVCSIAKLNGSPGIFPETMVGDLESQMPGVPLTNVVRMGIVPAAAPKSTFPNRAPTHFGLVCGVARLGFPTREDWTPPLRPPRRKESSSK